VKEEFKRPGYRGVIEGSERFYRLAKLRAGNRLDVEKAAAALGVKILKSNLHGEVSGYLFISKGRSPIIGVNKKHPETRQRFTIAHELGHFMLHAPKDSDSSFVDKSFFIVNRDRNSTLGIEIREVEANFFAAEILMPAETLYRDITALPHSLKTEEIYYQLAEKYGVSVEAMRFRLNNLGFIRLE
jgi:Zn-dependent peptidase ImmA (M78 family)